MNRTFHTRLGCSTISFRHQPLPQALETIAGLGFAEIDLGALPGVCDHVPYVLDDAAVADVAATVAASGLRVRSINGDIGDLNAPLGPTERATRTRHLDMLVALASATGAQALVLPCGALNHEPVDSLAADLDRVAAELVLRRSRRGRRRRRIVDRVAALPPTVLRHRAGAGADGPDRRPGRHRDGPQPYRRLWWRAGGFRRPLRSPRHARPHPRCRARQHQSLRTATATSTSAAASKLSPTPVTTVTSRWNSRLATSPTTNDPPRRSTPGT